MQDYFCLQPVYCTEHYTGTTLIRSPRGQKKLAVLSGDHINEGFFFYKKMYGRFAERPKKSGRKVGFHCITLFRDWAFFLYHNISLPLNCTNCQFHLCTAWLQCHTILSVPGASLLVFLHIETWFHAQFYCVVIPKCPTVSGSLVFPAERKQIDMV